MVCDELGKIANGKMNDRYEREIVEIKNYTDFGKLYCKQNGIELKEEWEFD